MVQSQLFYDAMLQDHQLEHVTFLLSKVEYHDDERLLSNTTDGPMFGLIRGRENILDP